LYRKRQSAIATYEYYSDDGNLMYWNNIQHLVKELQLFNTCSEQWRLFNGSSKVILKALLLYNRNKFPSITMHYAVHMKKIVREPSGFAAKR
jgi:hypothetical protein